MGFSIKRLLVFVILSCLLTTYGDSVYGAGIKKNKFTLIINNDKPLCDRAYDIFNSGIDFEIDYSNYKEFSWLNWKGDEIDYFTSETKHFSMKIFTSSFDIFNSGENNFVMKQVTWLSGDSGNQIFIFDTEPDFLKTTKKITINEYKNFDGIRFSTEYLYSIPVDNLLDKYKTSQYKDNDLIMLSNIHFMKFKNRIYIVLQQSRFIPDGPYMVLIGEVEKDKYINSKRGLSKTLAIDYKCYFDGNH